jgi:hypothetical protein
VSLTTLAANTGSTLNNLSLEHALVIETTLAHLSERCGLKYPGAHTGRGFLIWVAAYTRGIMLNRRLGRPDFAFAPLIV